MTSGISLNSLIPNSTTQTSPSSETQTILEQELAQESTQSNPASSYGPAFTLSLSPSSAAYVDGGAGTATGASQQSPQQSFWSDFEQLGQALQSGNLSAAQQAFSSLSQLPGVQSALQNNPTSPFAQELGQLGSALQSGNLGDAQQAFAALQQQADNSGSSGHVAHVGGHHHHHGGGGGESQQASSTASSSSSTSSDSSSASTTNSVTGLLNSIESALTSAVATPPVTNPTINLTA